MGRAGEGPEVKAWLEALNASAIFCDSVFALGVTEGAGATDWRTGEARGVPGISSSPGRGCQEAQGVGDQSYSHSCAELHTLHRSHSSWGAQPGAGVRLLEVNTKHCLNFKGFPPLCHLLVFTSVW